RVLFEETEDFYRRSRVSAGLCELRNMIAVAFLIIRSAQMRRESRGLHYMIDFPEKSPSEKRPTLV
ncbi:MAG: L-aspartate oxidase, partial [Rhodothermia bacterium]|nr:L-aspartate oxidase [Rhodothermia bacterium]